MNRLPGKTEIISDVPEPSSTPAFTPPSLELHSRADSGIAGGECCRGRSGSDGSEKAGGRGAGDGEDLEEGGVSANGLAEPSDAGIGRAFGAVMS